MNSVYQYTVTGITLTIGTWMDLRSRRIRRWLPVIYALAATAGHFAEICGIWLEYADRVERMGMVSAELFELGAGILPGVFFLFLSFITHQSLGYGDSLLILICGFSVGLPECMQIVMAALIGAGIWGLGHIVVKGADRRTEIAFVPFLFGGLLICLGQKM